jgi:hypothetical protein
MMPWNVTEARQEWRFGGYRYWSLAHFRGVKKKAAGGGSGRRGHGVMEVQTLSRLESRGGSATPSLEQVRLSVNDPTRSIDRRVQSVLVRKYSAKVGLRLRLQILWRRRQTQLKVLLALSLLHWRGRRGFLRRLGRDMRDAGVIESLVEIREVRVHKLI